MAIDVGPACSDRGYDLDFDKYTLITQQNAANATGAIDYICLYIFSATSATADVASFEEVSPDTFTTRGIATGLPIVAGQNEFNAPGDFTAFDINSGDYIGAHGVGVASKIVRSWPEATGYWNLEGDYIPCTNQAFSEVTDQIVSIYATGTEAGPAYTPKMIMIQSLILLPSLVEILKFAGGC